MIASLMSDNFSLIGPEKVKKGKSSQFDSRNAVKEKLGPADHVWSQIQVIHFLKPDNLLRVSWFFKTFFGLAGFLKKIRVGWSAVT